MAYTSFKTRKALGRRYGTDPALLMEMERLQQQYALSPGREARGIQAKQFAEELAFRKSESEQDREAAAKAGMVGTAGNLLTTGAAVRALTMEKGEPFFGETITGGAKKLYGGAKDVVGGMFTTSPTTIDAGGAFFEAGGAGGAISGGGAIETGGGFYEAGAGGGMTAPSGMSGMQAGAAVLGIEVARGNVGKWAEEQIGTSAGHASDIMSRGGQGAIIGAQFGGGYGAIAGAVIGTAVGIAEEIFGTVICSELYRQGLIDKRMLRWSQIHGKKHIPQNIYIGYMQWAPLVVRKMQTSPVFNRMFLPLAIPLVKQIVNVARKKRGTWPQRIIYKMAYLLSKGAYYITRRENNVTSTRILARG